MILDNHKEWLPVTAGGLGTTGTAGARACGISPCEIWDFPLGLRKSTLGMEKKREPWSHRKDLSLAVYTRNKGVLTPINRHHSVR